MGYSLWGHKSQTEHKHVLGVGVLLVTKGPLNALHVPRTAPTREQPGPRCQQSCRGGTLLYASSRRSGGLLADLEEMLDPSQALLHAGVRLRLGFGS